MTLVDELERLWNAQLIVKLEVTDGDVWHPDYDLQGEPVQVHVATGDPDFCKAAVTLVNKLPAILEALRTQALLSEALEALEPFAAQQAEWSYRLPDTQGFGVICLSSPADGEIVVDADMTMGDLRRARNAAKKLRDALTQKEKR